MNCSPYLGWLCHSPLSLSTSPGLRPQDRVHRPNDVTWTTSEPRPAPATPCADRRVRHLWHRRVLVHMGVVAGARCLGHEMAGVVGWVGAEVAPVPSATRSSCTRRTSARLPSAAAPPRSADPAAPGAQGGHPRRLFPVPDGSPQVAALAEPLGVGMQAVNQAEVAPGDKVAVSAAADRSHGDRHPDRPGIDDIVAMT